MAKMLVAGEWVDSASKAELAVTNPATGEVVDTVPQASPEDVDRAVAAARAAFPEWSRTDPEHRAQLLRQGIERVRAHQDEVVNLLVREQGKPTHEALAELNHLLHGLEYYADLATKLRGSYVPLPGHLGPSFGLVVRRPLGVVAAIVPWNYPLTLMGTKIGPALVAGNTVVVKPASTTPLAATRVVGLLQEAGLPPGVLNVVTGPGTTVGEHLVAHPDVVRVAFTGQTATGRRVMEIAGPAFKRVTLELGGSDPVIVCSDADLDQAVRGVLVGRYWNCGQSCLAAKRVYVFEEVYDAFVDKLLAGVSRYEPGEGWIKPPRPKIRMGPLHTARQREEVLEQMQEALHRGARVAYGGRIPEGRERGYFLEPTVLVDVPHDSRVVQEEVFGPVLPVFRVRDLDEAIRLANDCPYGLGSSIWTFNVRWIHRAIHELQAGMTWVNQVHYGYDELPFGGVKQSGFGKEHGLEALDYYVELKSVVVGGLA
ncbi:MAG: aldehyde dehydrogenase [candidate division GAL15 bacterium]